MKRFVAAAIFTAIIVFNVSAESDSSIESVFFNQNLVDCQKYCGTEPECAECVKANVCNIKYEKMKTFKGKGRNYTACKPEKSENYEECKKFCDGNYKCSHCDSTINCGVSYTKLKSFTGKGSNWYACEKIRDINIVWPQQMVIKPQHRYLVVANGGFGGMFGHDGIEWFCEKYLTPEIAPQALCIGSYGRPRTATWLLAENIKNTVLLMEAVTGVKPKVILVGKSMGGCKLHHAIAGDKGGGRGGLEKMEIPLFIGVDMSCQVKRHYESEGDVLQFDNNIKELYNFYQLNPAASQTGHKAVFKGKPFDENIHINVNEESFDPKTRKKISKPEKPLCNNSEHINIDECVPLLEAIQTMILDEIGKQ